jgi:acetylornithine deacetylase/succinyl-diaminopimelate desuccinylase-like protein
MVMVREVLDYIDQNQERFLKDLERLVRQPSVAAKNEGMKECAELVARMMDEIGIKAERLELPDAFPLVYGEIQSKKNPGKTVLFYDHYDVQPAEPLELWETPPFEPSIREGKMFGRGVADNKGNLVSRLKLVESWLKTTGDVPCNFKFLVEGEEEIGSLHLEKYFEEYGEKFRCDGVVWEFGGVDEEERPTITLGVKGILYVELEARGPIRDVHSATAAIVDNPAWRLVRALNTLKDERDRILIPGWYKDIKPFTKEELRYLKAEPFHEKAMKEELGIKSFIGGIKGLEAKKALAGKPTCTICGLMSGWTGPGSKTVLPSKALAKIDFRLVLGQKPKVLLQQLKKHLKAKGYGDIIVREYGMEEAARTPPNNPFVQAAVKAAEQEYPKPPVVSISSAGTGPMYLFTKNLKAPCICIGVGYPYTRGHSPNENIRIQDFVKGTKWLARTIDNFVKTK